MASSSEGSSGGFPGRSAADGLADEVTELVGRGGVDSSGLADEVTELVHPVASAPAPPIGAVDQPRSDSPTITWKPPARPRSPEPDVAAHRGKGQRRATPEVLLATVVLLLAIFSALVVYVVVAGDSSPDTQTAQPPSPAIGIH